MNSPNLSKFRGASFLPPKGVKLDAWDGSGESVMMQYASEDAAVLADAFRELANAVEALERSAGSR